MGVWGLLSNKVKNMKHNKLVDNKRCKRLEHEANQLLRGVTKKDRKARKYDKRVPRKYKIYIKSVFWKTRKNKYWQKFPRKCAVCGSHEFVELHHIKYASAYYGQEPDAWLYPLCHTCHEEFHLKYGTRADMTKETNQFIEDNYNPFE
jgi:hypothetical protein